MSSLSGNLSFAEVSNWMRFVRPAKSYKEQNLILSQQGTSLYFTTVEVIHPKQELRVWYSVWYSQTRNYSLLPGDPCGKFFQTCLISIDVGFLSSFLCITAEALYKDIDQIHSAKSPSPSPPNTEQVIFPIYLSKL